MTGLLFIGLICKLFCLETNFTFQVEPVIRSHTFWIRQFFVDSSEKRLLSFGGTDWENQLRKWSLKPVLSEKMPRELGKACGYTESKDGTKWAYCHLESEGDLWTVYFVSEPGQKPVKILEIKRPSGSISPDLFLDLKNKKVVCFFGRFGPNNDASHLYLWDWEKNLQPVKHSVPGDFGLYPCFLPQTSSLVVLANGRRAVLVWDLVKGSKSFSFDAPDGKQVTMLASFGNQQQVIVGCDDGSLYVWDMMQLRKLCHQSNSPISAAAFTPDESILFFGDCAGALHYYDFKKGKGQSNFYKEPIPITCMTFLPKSKRLVLAYGLPWEPDKKVLGKIVFLNYDSYRVEAVIQNDRVVFRRN